MTPRNVLYLKAEQCTTISNKKIFVEDVVKIYGENKNLVKDVSRQIFMTIKKDADMDYIVSILKVMEVIHSTVTNVELINLGETDFVIEYRSPKPERKVWEYGKSAFICLIAFFGAAFTIMTFNTDVGVSDVFDKIYKLVLGKDALRNGVVEIGYSIGLVTGVLIFYNHLLRKHIQSDLTPIQIEMRKFEEEKNRAKIMTASREGKSIDAD